MENYMNAIMVIILLVGLQIPCVLCFATKKCNHRQIETHLKETITCMVVSSDTKNDTKKGFKLQSFQLSEEHEEAKEVNEDCTLIDKVISCWTDHVGLCFDEDMNKDFITLIQWNFIGDPINKCEEIDGLDKNQISNKASNLLQYYTTDVDITEILKFDRGCSSKLLIFKSFYRKKACFQVYYDVIFTKIRAYQLEELSSNEGTTLSIC